MLIPTLLFLLTAAQAARLSPPGKPRLTSCRSPEKETFTCWWEPGSDGGLPTTHALFYRKENINTVYECSDYRTAGENSCFFNKNDTSIWVNYNITVVATNALGSNSSDPVDVDVMYIVQPHTPENVTAVVLKDTDGPFLRVSWEPPHKADTRSGWITLIYELRVRLMGEEEWETHRAGQQKMFNIYSLRSGVYMVEVRCKPDHGFWSEWSPAAFITVPDYISREKSMWILIGTFSGFIFLSCSWILNLQRNSLMHCLLPPVPGPKIKGLDIQLLKDGNADEVFGALVVKGFPSLPPEHKELLVEYLEVYISEDQEDDGGKALQDGVGLKPKISSSDCDSGHGSCDSHTLLMERRSERRRKRDDEDSSSDSRGGERDAGQSSVSGAWESEDSQVSEEAHSREEEEVESGGGGGRVKTWPSVFSSPCRDDPDPCPAITHAGSLDIPRQLCLSDSLLPPPSSFSSPLLAAPSSSSSSTHLETPLPGWHHTPQAHSDLDIPSMEHRKPAMGQLAVPYSSRSMGYVEVQRVSQHNLLHLQPISDGNRRSSFPPLFSSAAVGEDYSQVKGVACDNVLLLQRQVEAVVDDNNDQLERKSESGWTATGGVGQTRQEKTGVHLGVPPAREAAMLLTPNGYVDTAAILPTS